MSFNKAMILHEYKWIVAGKERYEEDQNSVPDESYIVQSRFIINKAETNTLIWKLYLFLTLFRSYTKGKVMVISKPQNPTHLLFEPWGQRVLAFNLGEHI